MNDKIRKRYNYWIEIGEYDLETARTMLRTGRLLYVGFMSNGCGTAGTAV